MPVLDFTIHGAMHGPIRQRFGVRYRATSGALSGRSPSASARLPRFHLLTACTSGLATFGRLPERVTSRRTHEQPEPSKADFSAGASPPHAPSSAGRLLPSRGLLRDVGLFTPGGPR